MITGIGVVVPAHNEQEHIAACVDALGAAVSRLPGDVAHAVCLVLDRCEDRTAQRAAEALDRHPGLRAEMVENRRLLTIGSVRDLGLRRAWSMLGTGPHETWLLSTDADSTVRPDWVLRHLRYAGPGARAVAGTVELDDPATLGPRAWDSYSRLVAAGIDGAGHRHVYAANLGVRADAYRSVGGFGAVASGEDHHLVRRLRAAGHAVVSATDLEVRTSARRLGRASGGLADLLGNLPDAELPELDVS
jgi:GT2 family glycosyltransferase